MASETRPQSEGLTPGTRAFAGLLFIACLVTVLAAAANPAALFNQAEAEPRRTGMKVNMNQDDRATLTLLPGVGPGIAEHIVTTREGGAVFHNAQDLQAVKRIGPKLVRRIAPWANYAETSGNQEPRPGSTP